MHHLRLRRPEHTRPARRHQNRHQPALRGTATAIGDTWAMVYTPNLVVGVWAGNADNSPMYNISSTSISWRSARDFMEAALDGKEALDFEKPDGVDIAKVCVPSNMLPTRVLRQDRRRPLRHRRPAEGKGHLVAAVQDRHPHRPPGDRDDAAAVRRSSACSSSCPPNLTDDQKTAGDGMGVGARALAAADRTEQPGRYCRPSSARRPRVRTSAAPSTSPGARNPPISNRIDWSTAPAPSPRQLDRHHAGRRAGRRIRRSATWDTTGSRPASTRLRLVVKDTARGELVSFVDRERDGGESDAPVQPQRNRTGPRPRRLRSRSESE